MNDWNQNDKSDLFDTYVDYKIATNDSLSDYKRYRNIAFARKAYTFFGIFLFISTISILPIILLIGLPIWAWILLKKSYLLNNPEFSNINFYKFFHKYRFVVRGIEILIVIIILIYLYNNPIYIG